MATGCPVHSYKAPRDYVDNASCRRNTNLAVCIFDRSPKTVRFVEVCSSETLLPSDFDDVIRIGRAFICAARGGRDEVVLRQYDGRTSGERNRRFEQGPLCINTMSVSSVPAISAPTGGSASLANSPTRRVVYALRPRPGAAWRSQPGFCSEARQTRKGQQCWKGIRRSNTIGIPSWKRTIHIRKRPGTRCPVQKGGEICTLSLPASIVVPVSSALPIS